LDKNNIFQQLYLYVNFIYGNGTYGFTTYVYLALWDSQVECCMKLLHKILELFLDRFNKF